MKASTSALVTLLLALGTSASVVPADDFDLLQSQFDGLQTVLSSTERLDGFANGVLGNVEHTGKNVLKNVLKGAKGRAERWIESGREFVKQQGQTYELLSHPAFSDYQLRVQEPSICDPDVQQYSGYLDISESKHLFFWFFESRYKPDEAPLILWLNGGPGCSSSTGLLFELGPCSVANEGKNLTYNPHSWNAHANIIFLDQPVNVGFSYTDDGSGVSTSPVAGFDVYAFLELFLSRYPKYAKTDFHIAAESYGGTYAPNFATVIHQKNKELELAPVPGVTKINLVSVMIGNGLTDPYIQDASIPEFACDGPYPIYDDPDSAECQSLRGKVPTCQRLINSCYQYNSRLACVPAALYCNSQLYGPIQQSGRNPYDVRRTCDPRKDTSLCYRQMGWIETWMNDAVNKKAVGAQPDIEFASCNMQVNQAFMMQGDGMHNSATLLTDLVNDGIRLLVYAGNADYMCNFIGNERWVADFDNVFHEEFVEAKPKPWVTLRGGNLVGSVRSAGGEGSTAGNVTYVTVYEAGHMVPFDQPEAALDLVVRWIYNMPLTNQTKAFSH